MLLEPVLETCKKEVMQKQSLKLCTLRLMPTEEAPRSLWDMSTCISRGIKANLQRKTHLEDKCAGTM